ncbi:TorF family putative porin [Comamonas sp. GB3 AK4-5]|uniref:TorF family putative porin n=1 Tax=Comamonas sp. GB3 AK4-5 TaxID=3231487 RepID=UPI00351E99F2
MKRVCCKTLALTALVAAPLWAQAELTANIALTSNYKFRGQDQDTGRSSTIKPALQGGFDYSFGDSGFYVGNWNSSVNWLPGNSLETDFYGGYKFKGAGVDWDVGALTYLYSGNSRGTTTELYGAGSYGPFTAKYSHTVSKDYFNWAGAKDGSGLKGRNTGYFQLAYSQELVKSVTLKASVGYTRFSSDIKSLGVPNYVDYSVGAAYDFGGGLSLTGAVAGANKKAYFGDVNKARLIVTLAKTL